MTSRMLAGAAAAAASLLVTAAPANASCLPQTDVEHLRKADAAFVGRVMWVGRNGNASFSVLSVRNGWVRPGTRVRVNAEPYPSSITLLWPPRLGKRWRVYVERKVNAG